MQMIMVGGRPALATFMDEMFVPVADPDEAAIVKLAYTDQKGGVVFIVPKGKGDWDESEHPRDDRGRFSEAGGGGASADDLPVPPAEAEAKPSPAQGELWPGKFPEIPAPGKEIEIGDFAKDNVEVRISGAGSNPSPKQQADFVKVWNETIGEDPGEFKNEFLGGVPATMKLYHTYKEDEGGEVIENLMEISGKLQDDQGNMIGSYTRTIDLMAGTASSDFFELKKGQTGKDIGKKILAANVEMYKKLGINEVEVHANIDVGGYAWAKYGYVPDDTSWSNIQDLIREKVGGAGYEPDSWEEMSSDQQDEVFSAWKDATESDFYDSEVENWRESGQALAYAKTQLADKDDSEWLYKRALKYAVTVGEGDDLKAQALGPFMIERGTSVESLTDNTTFDYKDRRGDGEEDPDVTVDWDTVDPDNKITDDQRSSIESLLVESFNSQAQSDAGDMDPPDYIRDGLGDLQSDIWNSMRDRDKYKWAVDNNALPTVGGGEIDSDEAAELNAIADSDDPKGIWVLADSSLGKEILLGSDWSGKLDLSDKETMDRFYAYVGKGKAQAAA